MPQTVPFFIDEVSHKGVADAINPSAAKNVSVIIPVYNTEKYLEKCLETMAAQTLDGIEIIIVNDGSPDNSQSIIDRYAARYPDRIRALKQENKGQGEARNLGVAQSQGEYIGFVDSDDWVSKEMFKLLYENAKASGSDAAMCDYRCIYDDDVYGRSFPGWTGKKEAPETVADFVLYSTNPAYPWNKIFKRELLLKTPFPSGIYEDLATMPIVLSNCKRISYLKKTLYYYLRRQGSTTTERNNPKNLRAIDAWKRCLEHCNPKYKEETAYAIYYSITQFLEYKPDCCIAYLDYFRENEPSFSGNGYIREAIQGSSLTDLFKFTSASYDASRPTSPYEQTIGDFLDQTANLVEHIDGLASKTAAELYDMYNTMLQLAANNISEITYVTLRELCHRQGRIHAKIST